jgi:Domain of unknown function (DUF1835)
MPASAATLAHVVNGDSVARTLASSALRGEIIVWRDVLHEGPLPPGDAATVQRARGAFLAEAGFGSAAAITADLAAADTALLAALDGRRETVLWFEHDLHDQLQLIQILTRVADHPERGRAQLLSIDRHPAHPRFAGLGELSGAELAALWPQRRPLEEGAFAVAGRAYDALRGGRSEELRALVGERHPGLPFLGAALARLLEERPWSGQPVGRSERQILRAVAAGAATKEAVFAATWEMEEAPYMGDVWVWRRIGELASGTRPYLGSTSGQLSLTDEGRAALAG